MGEKMTLDDARAVFKATSEGLHSVAKACSTNYRDAMQRRAVEFDKALAAIDAHLIQPAQALTAGQRAVAAELLRCCESWERGVRVMGNVQAGDAADLLRSLLAASSDDVTATDFATAMRYCGMSLHTFAKVDQRARQLAKERAAALANANGKHTHQEKP